MANEFAWPRTGSSNSSVSPASRSDSQVAGSHSSSSDMDEAGQAALAIESEGTICPIPTSIRGKSELR